MDQCEILIDTNIILHYKQINQIDWVTLSGYKKCNILIAPILLRELEEKKIFSPSTALKDRASRAIEFLVQKMALSDPIPLRTSVSLLFMDSEPTIDFAANKLVREVNDDHYIASAIEHQKQTDSPIFIASNDGGMALKIRSRPFDILRLPEELLLPSEIDAQQKELRQTKLELARLQNQRPTLAVEFANGSSKLEVQVPKELSSKALSFRQVQQNHPLLPSPKKTAGRSISGNIASLPGFSGSVERYNDRLETFYIDYKRYLAKLEGWYKMVRLTSDVSLILNNSGSATATDIDITLYFPETITLLSKRDFPKKPDQPDPPTKPGSLSDPMSRHYANMLSPSMLMPNLDFHDGAAYIYEDSGKVHFSSKTLKQKCVLNLDAFYIIHPAELIGNGIEVDVSITYNEGEPVDQKLAITFAEV